MMVTFDVVNQNVINTSIEVFKNIATALSVITGAAIMGRFLIGQISFAPASFYGEAILDLVKYLALCSMFPFLVGIIIDVTSALTKQIAYIPSQVIHDSLVEVSSRLLSDVLWAMVGGQLLDVFILAGAHAIYTLLVGALISCSAIIFFMSLILNISVPVRTYFSILITLCLWPVAWNIFGLLAQKLFESKEPFSSAIYWFAVLILQAFSPVFMFKLLNSGMATEAIGSVGTTASTIITKGRTQVASKPTRRQMQQPKTNLKGK